MYGRCRCKSPPDGSEINENAHFKVEGSGKPPPLGGHPAERPAHRQHPNTDAPLVSVAL